MIFFLIVYLVLVLLDAPILLFGLSGGHSKVLRVLAALWVAACALPLAVVIPGVVAGLVIAAVVVEGALYWFFLNRGQPSNGVSLGRDVTALVGANLAVIAMGRVIWGLGGAH